MKPLNTKTRSRERGQSLVEFALSFVLIFTLLSGVVSFGLGLFYYVAMRDAAQEGAVYGSLNPDDVSGIGDRIRDADGGGGLIYNIYTSGDLVVGVTYLGSIDRDGDSIVDPCEGDGITLTLTYDFPIFMPFIGTIIGDHTHPPDPTAISNRIHLEAYVTDTILTPVCPPPPPLP